MWLIITFYMLGLAAVLGGVLAPFFRTMGDHHPLGELTHRTQDRWSYAASALAALLMALFTLFLIS